MKPERITRETHPLYREAMELYRISFPPHEQREAASQAEILRDGAYHFAVCTEGGAFAGIALYWEAETFLYVEHLAVLPAMRNRGIGAGILALLKEKGKPVILEIDPPVDDVSVRRRGFYERNGFAENPYPHVHPPYHAANAGHPLVVMSAPRGITKEEYDSFARFLTARVMRGAVRA